MASPDNFPSIEPWIFRSSIADSWIPDAFARDTESALTKALQYSLFNHYQQSDASAANNHQVPASFVVTASDYCSTNASASTATATAQTPSGSGSEPETPGSKRRGSNLGVSGGKSVKRKSRASKRAMTTYIQADPSNFRQMVQQVTGVKLDGNGKLPVSMVMKPQPHRQSLISSLQGCLPTLDTSAYLLDRRHNDNNKNQQTAVSGSTLMEFSHAADLAADDGGAEIDFDSLFPTLESWS